MELHLGKMTNKELAEWFGIKTNSFTQHKKKKLEELKEFCFFDEVYGGVEITAIINPIYIKNNQKTGKEASLEHKEQVKSYNRELEKMKEEKICPYCKTELVLRKGKYGSFYGCKNYPKCKYTLKA
jgi:hypothetical protein